MHFNSMVLSDHTVIYPAYMDKDARLALRYKIQVEGISMYCGCSVFSENKLAYAVSSDARIVPMHQKYEHNPLCIRAADKRNTSYRAEEDGTARAFLKFDPKNFTVPKEDRTVDKLPVESDSKKNISTDNPPLDSLGQFILQLNTDTYKERVTAGKGLISADYFLPALTSRLKKVYIDGINKPVKDLDLQKDYFSFFYQPLVSIEQGEHSQITLKGWKKDFSVFIYSSILKRECEKFEKRYDISVSEALEDEKLSPFIMASGFIYLRLSKRDTLYKVCGRLHIFLVNKNGLYCRNMEEREELDAVSDFIRENGLYKAVQFHRIIDEERLFGILSCQGKRQILICKKSLPNGYAAEGTDHISFVTDHISSENLVQIKELLVGQP